jgi:hypothetical protein
LRAAKGVISSERTRPIVVPISAVSSVVIEASTDSWKIAVFGGVLRLIRSQRFPMLLKRSVIEPPMSFQACQ